jgi:hypothetical protein
MLRIVYKKKADWKLVRRIVGAIIVVKCIKDRVVDEWISCGEINPSGEWIHSPLEFNISLYYRIVYMTLTWPR